ncbi:MAG: RnfABCDGE type electron transport complex subunit D, partial [Erysipelotrichaceae bacterium]|nr:RnfABCDGE type electron transport complex subunit D [Erysipelotrichaceae bacterium]
TLIVEAVFAKIRKRDVKTELANSFGWVTAIILTLMVPVTMRIYALVIATVFAILFAKMLFGGFGHNIFNPAAVGRAVIFATFMGTSGVAADITTSATPTTVLANQYGWLPSNAVALDGFLKQYGGWKSILWGTYPGALGETFTLAIVLLGIFLIIRKIIDWRVPVVYCSAIFIMTMIVALIRGIEPYHGIPGFLWYPVLHLLMGGVLFGAFFMLTDPVTSPTSPAGRTLFALGAAIFTVLIRLCGNLPEGCLYSILLMNMCTPMIESYLDGKQLEVLADARKGFAYLSLVALAISVFCAFSLEPVSQAEGKEEAKMVQQDKGGNLL